MKDEYLVAIAPTGEWVGMVYTGYSLIEKLKEMGYDIQTYAGNFQDVTDAIDYAKAIYKG